MTQIRRLLLGPPGTGKTSRLIAEIERHLTSGTPPDRIALVSFTRAAVGEARRRAEERFHLDSRELPYFKTVHGLAYRQLGLRRGDVFGREGFLKLAEVTGEEIKSHDDMDAPTLGAEGDGGDALLFIDQMARATRKSLDEAWREFGGFVDWFRLKRFVDAYAQLRIDHRQIDFTDLLEHFASGSGTPPDVDVALIDEAQDLTPLQVAVVERAFADAREIVVAGDDDQAVHTWAGADPKWLGHFAASAHKVEVLQQSYRLPQTVFDVARGVVNSIEGRLLKDWYPADRTGVVEWHARSEDVDLGGKEDEWLLLARTRRQLASLGRLARERGIPHSVGGTSAIDPDYVSLVRSWESLRRGDNISESDAWKLVRAKVAHPPAGGWREGDTYSRSDLGIEASAPIWHEALTTIPLDDREYLLACRRAGESLTGAPRIRIDTVHGAKGLQANHVMLLTDLNERVARARDINPDAEARVCYVGVTRAREELHLIESHSRWGWQI